MGVSRRRRAGGRTTADLLAVVEAVLPALEAGLTPGAALALAADVAPAGSRPRADAAAGDRLAAAQRPGRADRPGSGRRPPRQPRAPELRLLAQAWSLTEDLGAPLAEAMRTTAGLLRARLRAERRTAGAVAGARATMNVLTALPFGGPFVAVALGWARASSTPGRR